MLRFGSEPIRERMKKIVLRRFFTTKHDEKESRERWSKWEKGKKKRAEKGKTAFLTPSHKPDGNS